MKDKKVVIGITGGLAAGKTTAANIFKEKGAVKVDADIIAHELLAEDEAIKNKIINLFGERVLSGENIDRRKLAKEVFQNTEKLKQLSNLLHPKIIKRIKEEVTLAHAKVVVIDAPLLIEAGLNDYVDIVIVIASDDDIRIKRATDRGISEEEAKNIINEQMSLSEKIKFADYIIENDGDLKKIKEGVEEIWQKI